MLDRTDLNSKNPAKVEKRQKRWARPPMTAEYMGVSEGKLADDRLRGVGLPFVRYGRAVIYDLDDADALLESRKVRSTSEADNVRAA